VSEIPWIKVCGEPATELAERVAAQVNARIASGEFARRDIEYVSTLDRRLFSGNVQMSEENFDRLRNLCRLWDIDIKVGEIRSHRPVIGPIIVAVKKVLLPILRMLLKDTIRQQRTFNGLVVETVAQIAAETSSGGKPPEAARRGH